LPRHFSRRWAVLLVCSIAGLAIAFGPRIRTGPRTLTIALDRDVLPANGYAQAQLHAQASNGGKPDGLTWRMENARNLADLEVADSDARLRAGVTPGVVTLKVVAPGFGTARVKVQLGLDPTDQFGDGTPDFLRLQSEDDRIAFRHWFAFLAESTYFQKDEDRPKEADDCAALIRFAYREALRKHNARWANQWRLAQLPNVASVRKYEYPHTALAAGLFRTKPGAFAPDDIANGTFAQFADAESLRRYNTHFVSRQLNAARPGDLLFFRQGGHKMPFHTMIYVGNSYFTDGSDWIIYHTGPNDDARGEIRRVTVTELQHHPEFCWRPLPQNPAFLGVYRWNILREED
jgi:uncharacterized protein YfaT (DUF1175 family)